MRIEIKSTRVYETGSPRELLRQLHATSTFETDSFRDYLTGFVKRLRPLQVWLEPPERSAQASDDEYADWLSSEMLRLGLWKETDADTTEEKEAKARAAAKAKKKAAAAKAAEKAAAATAAAAEKAAAAEEPAAS